LALFLAGNIGACLLYGNECTLGASNLNVWGNFFDGLFYIKKTLKSKAKKRCSKIKHSHMWGINADHLKSTSDAGGSDRKAIRGGMRSTTRESQYSTVQGNNV